VNSIVFAQRCTGNGWSLWQRRRRNGGGVPGLHSRHVCHAGGFHTILPFSTRSLHSSQRVRVSSPVDRMNHGLDRSLERDALFVLVAVGRISVVVRRHFVMLYRRSLPCQCPSIGTSRSSRRVLFGRRREEPEECNRVWR